MQNVLVAKQPVMVTLWESTECKIELSLWFNFGMATNIQFDFKGWWVQVFCVKDKNLRNAKSFSYNIYM